MNAAWRRIGESVHLAGGSTSSERPEVAAVKSISSGILTERHGDAVFQNQHGVGRRYRDVAGGAVRAKVDP